MTIYITPGEPAGIGPDVLIQAAQTQILDDCVILSNRALLSERAAQLGLPLRLVSPEQSIREKACLRVCEIPLACQVTPGQLQPATAEFTLTCLDQAIHFCQNEPAAALVTGPIHKSNINEAGMAFTGHTEYLAQKTASSTVVMLLVHNDLRVALATTHIPLRQVPQTITKKHLSAIIDVLLPALQQHFQLAPPTLYVCGVNPHAGEAGYLGGEEITVIQPVIAAYQAQGHRLLGPFPGDTVFHQASADQHATVLAMYHDQGLAVIKYASFGQAVNVTLGLPFIRTSVDHGTALALAGTGRSNPDSFNNAIKLAHELTQTA